MRLPSVGADDEPRRQAFSAAGQDGPGRSELDDVALDIPSNRNELLRGGGPSVNLQRVYSDISPLD